MKKLIFALFLVFPSILVGQTLTFIPDIPEGGFAAAFAAGQPGIGIWRWQQDGAPSPQYVATSYEYKLYQQPPQQQETIFILTGVTCTGSSPSVTCQANSPAINLTTGTAFTLTARDVPSNTAESPKSAPFLLGALAPGGLVYSTQ